MIFYVLLMSLLNSKTFAINKYVFIGFYKNKLLCNSLIIFFILWQPSLSYGQKLIAEIKLPEKTKNISNLSGKLNDSISFHLITNFHKKSNTYVLTPYFVDFENKLDSINSLFYRQKHQFSTFFSDGNVLSLLGQINDQTVLMSLDYKQKKVSQKYLDIRVDKVFSYKDFCIVFERPTSFKEINFALIKSKDSIVDFNLSLDDVKQKSFFKDLLSGTGIIYKPDKVDFINDKAYIEKGSVKPIKGFWSKNKIIFFSNSKSSRNLIDIFEIDLKGRLSERTLDILPSNTPFINQKSLFLIDDLIFVLIVHRKSLSLEVYNYDSLKKIKSFHYNKNSFFNINEIVINGNKVSFEDLKFNKFLRGFYAKAMNYYVPGAYIGVNKDISNKFYLVEMGHVHRNQFVNVNSLNSWLLYDEFRSKNGMSKDNQATMGLISIGVGMIALSNMDNKMKGNYIKVQLDENMNFTETELISQFPFFDRLNYEKKYNNLRQLKNYFFIPMRQNIRLIKFNNKEKRYEILSLE